jgi:hypothetical protein
MSTLDGFDDLKAKDIVQIKQDGTAAFIVGERLVWRQLQIAPGGGMTTREIEPVPIDQSERAEDQPTARRVPVAQRWAGTDQGGMVS